MQIIGLIYLMTHDRHYRINGKINIDQPAGHRQVHISHYGS